MKVIVFPVPEGAWATTFLPMKVKGRVLSWKEKRIFFLVVVRGGVVLGEMEVKGRRREESVYECGYEHIIM